MNKKLLMFALIPLVLSVMVAPAMAKPIGPQKAEKNPNIMITPEGAELLLNSSGVMNEWTANTSWWYMDFIHAIDASKGKGKAKIRAVPLTIENLTALMTDPAAALEAENMWGYISHDVLLALLILEGYEPEEAEAIAAMWPEGIYAMFVNVGK